MLRALDIMMNQTITLNLPYDLTDSEWGKVLDVYKSMDGWQDNESYPCWFGTEDDEQNILVSVEPSGLVISGSVNEMLWFGWITVLCAKLTLALGREIHDADV